MGSILRRLHDAIGELGDLDAGGLSDSELHDLVVAVQQERARLGAAAADLLGRWDRSRVWAGDGSRSASARLARDTRSSAGSASVELRRARQLRSMPSTAAAVARGELSLDHVDLLGRANQPCRAGAFAEHEAVLVAECVRLRFAHAVRIVEYWCQRADAQTNQADPERRGEGGRLHASATMDGTVVLDAVLEPIGGAAVLAELARLEREHYLADERQGIERTAAQRRADALVTMAERSATTPTGGRRPKPLFTVLLGDDTFTRLCELSNGTVLTPGQLVPWLGTAELETVLFDGPSTVVSVSHRRAFTGAVRRAIEVRDRHCQHPSGCDVPSDRCDVDHIVPYSQRGESSQFNGRLECSTHNRHSDKHDHHAVPLPSRPVTRLDELRVRLRWRYHHDDRTEEMPVSR